MIEFRLLLALLSREILIFGYPKRGTKLAKERVAEEGRCLRVCLVSPAPGRHTAAHTDERVHDIRSRFSSPLPFFPVFPTPE